MIGTHHLPWTASCRRWRRRHLGKAQLQTDVSWGSPCSKMTMYCTTSEHTSCLDHCSQPKSVSLWRTEHTLFFTAVLMLPWAFSFCSFLYGVWGTAGDEEVWRGLCVGVGVERWSREGRAGWGGRVGSGWRAPVRGVWHSRDDRHRVADTQRKEAIDIRRWRSPLNLCLLSSPDSTALRHRRVYQPW